MKLTRFKKKALVKERTFLEDLMDEVTKEVSFARMSKEMMRENPSTYYWYGSLGSVSKNTLFHLVIHDGSVMKNAIDSDFESGSNYAGSRHTSGKGESLAEGLDRLDLTCQIEFVVRDEYYDNSFPTGWTGKRRSLTVYKLPKKGSVAEIISAVEEDEIEEVAAFIAQST